jgi:EAL domain-containing protein (putative c-di-GMP-specific phosphodiesterase class I)
VTVVAEGVETAAELDAVLGLGCDLVQGYLLAKPGPAFPPFAWPRASTVP